MEININGGSIESAVAEISQLDETAQALLENARQSTLNGSYSGVSGLDQLGSGHGSVLNGGPGSAMTVLESYAEQISWLHQALVASHSALTGQNAFVSRGMDVADEGGVVGADSVAFPQRPVPRFENFSFNPPVVAPALSIDQLAMDFSTTNIGASTSAGAAWQAMSEGVASVAAGLHGVAGKLAADNSGDVIDAATQKVSEVAAAGDTFSRNSAVMAASVQQLAKIKSQGNVQVNLARAALAGIADPVQKKAAEHAFLASFPASFTPSVVTGVPPIRNLMSLDGPVDGGGEVALGMNDVEGDGPAEVDGLSPAGAGAAAGALNALRTVATAGQFGSVDQGVGELSTVGANSAELGELVSADGLGTTSASLNSPGVATSAPTLPNTVVPGGPGALGTIPGATGASGTGVPFGPIGTAGAGASGTGPGAGRVGALGRTPGVTPATGALPAAAPGRAGGLPGGAAHSSPLGGAGAPVMGTFGNRAGGSAPGSNPGVRGVGGPGGVGGTRGVGGGGVPGVAAGGMGAVGAGHRTGGSANVSGAAGPGSGAAGDHGQARSATAANPGAGAKSAGAPAGRGMVPMMGAPMAGAAGGQQGKPSKVRTVTSAVEEDGNIAALLGDRGPVVPGVIGAWARG